MRIPFTDKIRLLNQCARAPLFTHRLVQAGQLDYKKRGWSVTQEWSFCLESSNEGQGAWLM